MIYLFYVGDSFDSIASNRKAMNWYLCFKPGRALGWPNPFASEEAAQTFADEKGFNHFHPVESTGDIEVSFGTK